MNPFALITGASRGLGRGVAFELARIGFDLLLNFVRDRAAAEQTRLECLAIAEAAGQGIRCEHCQADIASTMDRDRLMERARSMSHDLSLLVNNAGVAPAVRADILESSEESFDRLISINVKGPYFLTQLAAKWMIQGAEESRGKELDARFTSKVVTITSISAYTASVNRAEYCVAKAALSMITPLYAARLADHGINVYEIRPGIMATDMTEPVKERYDLLISQGLTPIRRWGRPSDVGQAVAAIAQGLLPFSTGEVINVDGGFHLRRL